MKTLMVLFFFAMVVCAMSQYYYGGLGSYSYGYNTHTPGASVSSYSSANTGHHYPYYGNAYRWW